MKLTPWEPDLRTVVDRIDSGDIDLQPDFQRQEIWPPSKKRRLIDTVLRGWSIPPIFLVVARDGRMDVLDGQQRLAALRDFIHNEFPVDGAITPPDPRIQELDGVSYKRLDSSIRRLLDQYTLRCFRITDYSPDEPSELFYRLNQPSMLTAGEQRNAFYGPAREQLKELVRVFETGGNEKKTIGFSNARLAYDDIIARLLFFLEAKTFAIKSTEALISQRFRTGEGFNREVFGRASQSIQMFTEARNAASVIRLNKASTLSWLLFFSRFRGLEPDIGFMSEFINQRDSRSLPRAIQEAVKVFVDRASLRVTDITSVAYRDVCLWYVYVFTGHSRLPIRINTEVLESLYEISKTQDDVAFEFVLSKTVNIETWSDLS